MKITILIVVLSISFTASTPVLADCDVSCTAVTAYYKTIGKTVKHCTEDLNRQIFYWDIETKNGHTWQEAKSDCKMFCSGKPDLAKIQDDTEFGFLKQLLDNKIADHWLNFKLDQTDGNSLFQALIKHQWKWEDGSNFTYGQDNWDGDTGHCDNFGKNGGCLLFWPGGTFGLDPCNNNKIALCRMTTN